METEYIVVIAEAEYLPESEWERRLYERRTENE